MHTPSIDNNNNNTLYNLIIIVILTNIRACIDN
jgi:hypothetical protein